MKPPMLCEKQEHQELRRDLEGWIGSIKFDGTRVLIHLKDGEAKLINRRGKEISHKFPELQFPSVNVVLDSELVIFRDGKSDFNKIVTRGNVESKFKIEILSEKYPSKLMVFDVLSYEGEDLTDKPLSERKEILSNIPKTENLKIVDYVRGEGIRELWEKVKEKDLEGIILKKLNSKYKCGRSRSWLKVKNLKRDVFEVVGYKKSDKREVRSLILSENGKYRGRVGSGFSDDELKRLKEKLDKNKVDEPMFKDLDRKYDIVWIKPKKLKCQVEYLEETKGGKLRHPVFEGLIND